jgi:hypothetical protein
LDIWWREEVCEGFWGRGRGVEGSGGIEEYLGREMAPLMVTEYWIILKGDKIWCLWGYIKEGWRWEREWKFKSYTSSSWNKISFESRLIIIEIVSWTS